jgi:hypothetical protein
MFSFSYTAGSPGAVKKYLCYHPNSNPPSGKEGPTKISLFKAPWWSSCTAMLRITDRGQGK